MRYCNAALSRFCFALIIGFGFFPLAALTRDTDVVINEIHFHPSSDFGQEEYIELYNKGSEAVDLSGWAFVEGIFYTFPTGTNILPGQFILVARDQTLLKSLVPNALVIGNYTGTLNDGGEEIKLYTARGDLVDGLTYSDRFPWSISVDGEGPSLERISPFSLSDRFNNWQSGWGLPPNQWVYIQKTGVAQGDVLSFHLSSTGTVLIDDIVVTQIGSTSNRVLNGGQETTWDSSWTKAGTHSSSARFQSNQAHTGSYVLQVATLQANGEKDSNYVRHTLSNINVGGIYQLSFWVRIGSARGDLSVELGGDTFALHVPLQTHSSVGASPGSRNTVYSENLPPVISSVARTPKSPMPNETVALQAQIEDADGVETVFVEYRVSANNRWGQFITMAMSRISGTEQDGLWQATLPAQADRTFVSYRIVAVDRQGIERVFPSPTEQVWTETYFHYRDDQSATIPVVFLHDFGFNDVEDSFRGNSAFVYRPPQGADWTVFDHIIQSPRKGGWNVYFHKGYELEDMSSINVVSEPKPRYTLAEWLSYNLYRSVGVPASKVDHYRFFRNNNALGYYLMFEQPNRHFIARNGINNEGNLYKMIYNFDHTPSQQNIIRQHLKRTNLSTGHDDVVELIQTYFQKTGTAETVFIETYFDVDELINYFVVCQLISDWDGYFNNHYVYHDSEGSGLWYMFPWDKDKTWGDSDAYRDILPYYDFYDMPILFGADGTRQSGRGNRTWWRPPGFFSGKFLANPTIQNRYLHRLGYVAYNEFTPEKWHPIINELEVRLEPEIRYKAQVTGQNVNSLLTEFHNEIESFRRQVANRREFIINEVEKLIGPVEVADWDVY